MDASFSFKKRSSRPSNIIIPPKFEHLFSKIENFNTMGVLKVMAKRKTDTVENHTALSIGRKAYKKDFQKLIAPYRPAPKQNQGEVKIMTKTCESLLECMKPYRDIKTSIRRKAEVTESVRSFGSILKTTDIMYEKKATRKVQFFSFSEENSEPSFLFHKEEFWMGSGTKEVTKEEMGSASTSFAQVNEVNESQMEGAVSSEDFITDVFSTPKSALM